MKSNGDTLWTKVVDGSGFDSGTSVVEDGDSLVFIGETWNAGNGEADIFAFKTDKDLTEMSWVRSFGGVFNDVGRKVIKANDGGYLIVGETNSYGNSLSDFDGYVVKISSNGDLEWGKTYGGLTEQDYFLGATQTSDGYVIAGRTKSFGSGKRDFYVIKIDELGNVVWEKAYGGPKSDF